VKRIIIALATSFLLSTLCGCGASLPTEEAVKEAIQRNSGPIKVVSFHKTNGQRSVINGVEKYTMECNVEVEFTEDCFYGGLTGAMRADRIRLEPGWDRKKKGERAVESRVLTFEMTENGWR
jgi:hypothetical protein